ncbi:MAG: hypothetical protein JNK49_21740 [Planctomycetes bacterium]|nr:hypothetical protein [Planctomycetota bacterium]
MRRSWFGWLAAAVWLVGVGSVPAQELAWRLPLRGAVEYRRTWQAEASGAFAAVAQARAAATAAKVPERYLHRLPPAPFLCQGELDSAQRAIADPVRDLRDVLRALAFDLQSRSGVRSKWPRVLPFGDLQVVGSWTNTPDGGQELRGAVSARPAAALPDEKGTVARLLQPFCVRGAEGTVVLRRSIDGALGVVRTFSGSVDLVVEEDEKQFRRLVLRDEWQFLAVRDNQDFDFRKRVQAAIERGVAFVREAVRGQKSFLGDGGKEHRSYGSGRLALALLTMLHGHVPPDDAVLLAGFAELRRRELVDTYSLAAALMAVAARYESAADAERLAQGGMAALPVRKTSAEDQEAVQRWTKQLLANLDPRTDPQKVLRFNYVAGPRYDTSLQQYGLLGLWSAHLCGVDVPGGTFAAAARHLLQVQGPPAGTRRTVLTSHAQVQEGFVAGVPPRGLELRTAPRGFAYEEAQEPAFGSMTSAGVSGLLLAIAGMQAKGHGDKALLGECEAAVAAGYAWLAAEFSVRCNPGFAERSNHHWYYWLYGLERSCELRGVEWLDGRDWYYEGALQLLAQQQANGAFRTEFAASMLIESTCFAVLFLARSTPSGPATGK